MVLVRPSGRQRKMFTITSSPNKQKHTTINGIFNFLMPEFTSILLEAKISCLRSTRLA